jgi:type 1 fimbriae regulatory protein FimB/type 1 fimbriae regulatory protein FimE
MGVKPMQPIQPQTQVMAKYRRSTNKDTRPREHLASHEVDSLRKAARNTGRNGHRDDTLILVMYRHGLRASEACALKWAQVDFMQATIHVNRSKCGISTNHPLHGPTLRALRALRREHPDHAYVFITELGTPMTIRTVHQIVARAGDIAKLGMSIHPHMLRHACGYYLACKGTDTRAIQQYLGHRSIESTALYTALSPGRFDGFWPD